MKEQEVFILFGEGVDTNVEDLNNMLAEGWTIVQMCPMPSAMSTTEQGTRFYEPQCAVVLEKEIDYENE